MGTMKYIIFLMVYVQASASLTAIDRIICSWKRTWIWSGEKHISFCGITACIAQPYTTSSSPQILTNNNPFVELCLNHSCFQMDKNICWFFISLNCVFWNDCKLLAWVLCHWIRLNVLHAFLRTWILENIGLVSHPHALIPFPSSTQHMLQVGPAPVSSQTGMCLCNECLHQQWNGWYITMPCTAAANTIVQISVKKSHIVTYSWAFLRVGQCNWRTVKWSWD